MELSCSLYLEADHSMMHLGRSIGCEIIPIVITYPDDNEFHTAIDLDVALSLRDWLDKVLFQAASEGLTIEGYND